MLNIQEKLTQIDNLLLDDVKLNKYILEIESENSSIPDSLNNNIYKKLDIIQKGNNIIKLSFKEKFVNVLKIVACMLFSLILWQYTISNPKTYADTNGKHERHKEFYQNIDKFTNSINDFLMKPSEIKGGKNK